MPVYQHQLHAHKTRRPHPVRYTIITLLVLAGGVIAGLQFLEPNTQINNAEAVTKTLEGKNSNKETFYRGTFKIELPKGWQFTSKQQDVYTIYHFKSAMPGADGNRSLDIYEDTVPLKFAVNRMLPVVASDEGGLTTDASLVSDNCVAYTTGSTTNRQTISQLAKWQGIEFLCDMSNSLRNTVGTGSTDGLNFVSVKSATSRPHKYFFTYTDSNDKPDYGLFADAVNSFQVTE